MLKDLIDFSKQYSHSVIAIMMFISILFLFTVIYVAHFQ